MLEKIMKIMEQQDNYLFSYDLCIVSVIIKMWPT